MAVVTGVAHEVDLQIVSTGVVTQYWDGTGTINNNNIAGGSGTWNGTTSNWTTSTGATNSTWAGGMAVFDAPGGTVTLGTPINAQGLSFGSTGYTPGRDVLAEPRRDPGGAADGRRYRRGHGDDQRSDHRQCRPERQRRGDAHPDQHDQ